MSKTKSEIIPVRLEPSVVDEIDQLKTKTGLSRSDLLRMVLAAGVKAIAKNGHSFRFPLEMEVSEGQEKSSKPVTKKGALPKHDTNSSAARETTPLLSHTHKKP